MTLVPAVERGEEPRRNTDERELLVSLLEWHRATMARKCDGLAADQLGRRSCPPSELTLLGLVRHLTEIERAWSPVPPNWLATVRLLAGHGDLEVLFGGMRWLGSSAPRSIWTQRTVPVNPLPRAG